MTSLLTFFKTVLYFPVLILATFILFVAAMFLQLGLDILPAFMIPMLLSPAMLPALLEDKLAHRKAGKRRSR